MSKTVKRLFLKQLTFCAKRSIDLFAQLRIIEKFEVLQASKKFDVLILRVLNFKIKIIPQGFNGYDQLRSFTSIENENGNWEKPT